MKIKEILIATVGENPQIVTELLYYYSHPFYKNVRNFDEIIISQHQNTKN